MTHLIPSAKGRTTRCVASPRCPDWIRHECPSRTVVTAGETAPIPRGRAAAARRAHTPEVAGSIPAHATPSMPSRPATPAGLLPASPAQASRRGVGSRTSLSASRRFFGPRPSFAGLFLFFTATGRNKPAREFLALPKPSWAPRAPRRVGLLFWVCPGASRMSMPARMGPGTDNEPAKGPG